MASRLLMRNAIFAVLEAPEHLLHVVSERLTVPTPGAQFSKAVRFGRWDGNVRFLRRPGNLLPSGLVPLVKQILEGLGEPVSVVEPVPLVLPLRGTPTRLQGVELREYQEDAVAQAFLRQRLALECPTGGGKTEIGAEVCRRVGGPVLWVVHTRTLLDQTHKRLQALLPGVPVHRAGGGLPPDPLQVQEDRGILVATVQTLVRQTWPPRLWAGFRTLIVDEAHHAGAESWLKVANKLTGAWYRIGLSGTLTTASQEPLRAFRAMGALGPTYRVVSTEALVAQGFLAKPLVQWLGPDRAGYPSYPEVRDAVCPDWRRDPRQLARLGGKLFRYAYEQGIVRHLERNVMLMGRAAQHVQQGEKVLMLCTRLEHGQLLLGQARRLGLPAAWISGEESAQVRRTTLARFPRVPGGALLVASTILQEGVDLPSVDVLVLAGGGASEIASIQRVGRALRPRPDKDGVLIYDCLDGRDIFNPKDYLAQHTLDRLRTYRAQRFAQLDIPAVLARILDKEAAHAPSPSTL